MPVRITLLMQVATDPTDRSTASPHIGGWSESFYFPGTKFPDISIIQGWGKFRAAMLAGECSVVGYRQQLYTINKNKLLPGGSASGSFLFPGVFVSDLNAPQDSLMMNWILAGQPQTIRTKMPGLPDSQVSSGEYQPTKLFAQAVLSYIQYVTVNQFSGVSRDLTQPDCRVKSFTAGSLTTLSATGAVPGDYIRFRRVKDDNNNPVEGTYLVQTVVNNADSTVTYTLFGTPPQTVSRPNGTCRRDVLVNPGIIGGTANRLVIRKVGRPFQQYRGRRSKRPA